MSDENSMIINLMREIKTDLNNSMGELERHVTVSMDSLKEATIMSVTHIKDDLESLKLDSRQHFKNKDMLLSKFAEAIGAHALEDVRHIEELDIKLDNQANKHNILERETDTKINNIRTGLVEIKALAQGKKSNGNAIIAWSSFGVAAIGFVFLIADKINGGI